MKLCCKKLLIIKIRRKLLETKNIINNTYLSRIKIILVGRANAGNT